MPALPHLARSVATGIAALAVLIGSATPALAETAEPPERETPSERAAAVLRPALVQLTVRSTGWVRTATGQLLNAGYPYEVTSSCSGFGVNPNGYVATAGHCVDTTSPDGFRSTFIEAAAQDLVATTPGLVLEQVLADGFANWTVEGEAAGSPAEIEVWAVSAARRGAEPVPARVVDFRPLAMGDVALLKVDVPNLPSLELAPPAEVPSGTPVLAAGYPGTVDDLSASSPQPSIKDGQVSGRQSVASVPFYEISAALSGGMSGGPTVDLDSRVLGINSFSPAGEPQAFNFITDTSVLTQLLDINAVRNELSDADRSYRSALAAYHEGRYSDAIAAFDAVLQAVPGHTEAERLRADAVAAREQFGDPTLLSPLVAWLITGAAIVLGAGIGTVLGVRRARRRRRPAPLPWPAAPGGRPAGVPFGGPGQAVAQWAQPVPPHWAPPIPAQSAPPVPAQGARPVGGPAAAPTIRLGDGTPRVAGPVSPSAAQGDAGPEAPASSNASAR